jgi:hypothetical protein
MEGLEIDVQLPDGRIITGVPEGTTKAQLSAKLTRLKIDSDPISTGARNFAADMPWLQQAAAGYGKAIPDMAMGVGQMVGLVPDEAVNEMKRLDAPLMKTGGGVTGNIIGNAAAFAPTAAIPGAGSLPGAALLGAAGGATIPVGTNESRSANMALGAGAGAGGQLLGRAIGRLARPVDNALNPVEQNLAGAAGREGIPLTAGQRTGSRPLQIAESVMENLPLTSGPQLAQKEAQQRAFTAAVLRKGGMAGDIADAGTMLTQKRSLGKSMEAIANANKVDFTQRGINAEITRILDDATNHLPPADSAKLSGTVDQILKQVDQSGQMAGTNYQGWREPLRALAKQGDSASRYYGQLRKALDDSFAGQLTGNTAAAFKDASRKYANTKTIIDAMGGPGALPAKGQVPPSQLGNALARSIGKENKTLGGGDLNELARVGQLFVKDQIPNSGTAQRQFIQSLLTGGGGAGVGAGIAAGTGNDPVKGALYGGAAGIGAAAAPRAIQMIMNSPAGQAYLTKGILPIDPAMRAALAKAIQIGGMASVPALTQ